MQLPEVKEPHRVKGFARECSPIARASPTKPLMPQKPIRPAAMFKLGMTPTVNPSFKTYSALSVDVQLDIMTDICQNNRQV